jgi:quercetin dioxygenase-like cupin family protein
MIFSEGRLPLFRIMPSVKPGGCNGHCRKVDRHRRRRHRGRRPRLADDLAAKNRVELKRADLSVPGANMEVVMSITEYPPGEVIARHIHHGEEALYVVQGATAETPDGKQIELKTGTGSMNLRDVPHAGIKIVGTTALKLLTVHVVDKGKPLYDAPPK